VIAADRFVPLVGSAAARGPVVADGFSCELQAAHLAGVATTTLAELLADVIETNKEEP